MRVTRKRSLTHLDSSGAARMVDVGDKPATARVATAEGFVRVSPATLRLVRAGTVKKGDPLEVARIAGIQAAKRTSDLIPLCHPLALTHVDVDLHLRRDGFRIVATARTTGQTGVEMEALTAVSVAALTVYDMLKAADPEMIIDGVRLLEKKGGTSNRRRRE
jgi:cyclic pyranopterin phosphate synthase